VIADDVAQQLHHRATLGQQLSAEEQAQLAEWYAAQDAAEQALLSRNQAPSKLQQLREQVRAAMAQVSGLAERNQRLAAENEKLRHEIEVLQQQLAQKRNPQPA
jgi:peptidoglycan hydrolase CwlO-like protein